MKNKEECQICNGSLFDWEQKQWGHIQKIFKVKADKPYQKDIWGTMKKYTLVISHGNMNSMKRWWFIANYIIIMMGIWSQFGCWKTREKGHHN